MRKIPVALNAQFNDLDVVNNALKPRAPIDHLEDILCENLCEKNFPKSAKL